MSKGTEPTPIRVTPRYSLKGEENLHRVQSQMLQQGASTQTIIEFANEAERIRKLPAVNGQIEPITQAAKHVGAEVHWVN